MKTVWAITDGCYSDYHVVGIFSSRANAEIIQRYMRGEVEEWPLDPAVKEINAGLCQWTILMRRDGTVERVDRSEISSYGLDEDGLTIWLRTKAPIWKGREHETCDVLNGRVWAKTATHAVKVANEIRTQMIAEGKWA